MAGSFLESYVLMEKEGTWGTAATGGMIRIPVLSWDVQASYDTYESQMITGAAGASAPAFGVKRVQGRMSVEAGYSGLDGIFNGILGTGRNSAGASDPFTNIYAPASTVPSWTFHVSYGDVPTGKVIEFQGMKFNTVELSFDAAQGYMNVSCDLIGEEANSNTTTGVTPGTTSQTVTHEPIVITPSAYVTTADIGVGASLAYCIRSGTIRIERFLSANRICIGSDAIKEPVPDRPMRVSGTFNIEFIDLAAFDAFTQKTVHTTTQLKWDGGTHSIDIKMPKVVYTQALPPIQSGDVLVAPVNFIAYGTTTASPVDNTCEPITVTIESAVDYDSL